MRKIASNYIFLPGYPLVRYGYVVLEGREVKEVKEVKEVVDAGGVMRETAGVEFYGGMVVAPFLLERERYRWRAGDSLLSFLAECYRSREGAGEGLALLQGADWQRMVFREETVIERLI